jgi:SAM-dependent methyltransferase
MMTDNYIQTNQSLWDKKVKPHTESDFYQVEAFKKGWNSLRHIEMNALGKEVKNKSMLHLQCHFGQDSLSWARLGATVTGIDFSAEAIKTAQQLNDEMQLDARFIQSSVYDVRKHIQEQFDIVFTSYGVIGWLPDLHQWAEVIGQSLKPNGTFYMVEFHPGLVIYDFGQPQNLRLAYDYFHHPTPDEALITGTYADASANLQHQEFTWSHSISEIITPLLKQGLILETFQEYPYSTWNCFSNLHEAGEEKFVFGSLDKSIPHLLELKMRKP